MTIAIILASALAAALLGIVALALWPVRTGLDPIRGDEGPGRGGIVTDLLSGI